MLIPAVSALSLAFAGGTAGCSDDDDSGSGERLLESARQACSKIDACYGYDTGCADDLPDYASRNPDGVCIDLITNYLNCINRSSCDDLYDGDCGDEYYAYYYACDDDG